MTTDIKQLRELHAAGTAGKWAPRYEPHGDYGGGDTWHVDGDNISCLVCDVSEPNAALICAAVNALPALLDEVEQLRSLVRQTPTMTLLAEAERLRSVLRTEGTQYVVESGNLAAQGPTPQEAVDALVSVAIATGELAVRR